MMINNMGIHQSVATTPDQKGKIKKWYKYNWPRSTCEKKFILKWNVKKDPWNFKSPCFHIDFSLTCSTFNHYARRYAIVRKLKTQHWHDWSEGSPPVDNSSPLLYVPFQHFTIYGLLYRYFCVSVLITESLPLLSVSYFCLFTFHLLSLPIIVRALVIWFHTFGAMQMLHQNGCLHLASLVQFERK